MIYNLAKKFIIPYVIVWTCCIKPLTDNLHQAVESLCWTLHQGCPLSHGTNTGSYVLFVLETDYPSRLRQKVET